MSSELKTNKISPATGTALTLADSGDTLTLPSGATLAVASGATITNSGTATGFGKVLQVVTVHKADNFTTTSGTYVDVTGLSVSITPSSASNKILILGNMVFNVSGDHNAFAQLLRDSTVIASSTGNTNNSLFAVNGNSTAFRNSGASEGWAYLDSPSTTSSTTYKIQIKSGNGVVVAAVNTRSVDNHLGGSSNITLMEIAG